MALVDFVGEFRLLWFCTHSPDRNKGLFINFIGSILSNSFIDLQQVPVKHCSGIVLSNTIISLSISPIQVILLELVFNW
jgi:hypothetical protein